METKSNNSARADCILRGGEVIDGSGGAPFRADVALCGERIVAVGNLHDMSGDEYLDATDRIIAPGFIDVHAHDDRCLLEHPDMAPKVSQGVTTVVVGNCGLSLSPHIRPHQRVPKFSMWEGRKPLQLGTVADFIDELERACPAVNAAVLVGHSTLRCGTMSDLGRPATSSEIGAMQDHLRSALEAGAVGLSSGLFYDEARSAPAEEIKALTEVLDPFDGIYTAHIRNEADHVLEAIEEAADIGQHANIQVVLSHHKCVGVKNYGRSRETLPVIDRLRSRQRLSLDVYPYTASSTTLMPKRSLQAEKVLITWSTTRPDAAGRDLDEVAAEMGLGRQAAAERLSPAGAIYFMMHDDDVRRIIAYPHSMIGSDGIPDDQHPHPRLWGTFPRVLGYYARELGIITLEEAIRRMTSLPATQFGFKDRGSIHEGAYADLVIFDPRTVRDEATFEQPKQPAAGIEIVFVNGQPVWRDGAVTGRQPGRAIRLQETTRGRGA